MKNIMEMNGFQELNDVEVMETEGGNPLLIPVVVGVVLFLTGCNGAPTKEDIATHQNCIGQDECKLAPFQDCCPYTN